MTNSTIVGYIITGVFTLVAGIGGVWLKSVYDHRIAKNEQEIRTAQYWRDEVPMLRKELAGAMETIKELQAKVTAQGDLIASLYRRIGELYDENQALKGLLGQRPKETSSDA